MTLREQYETLLRRGMPEHDELEWRGSEDFGIGVWVFSKNEPIQFGIGPVFMGERFARDLITMHALRWARTRGFDFVLSGNNWQVAELFERDKGDVIGARCYAESFDDALECIVRATAHLEPKKTLA